MTAAGIKRLRQRLSLTQTQFAQVLGVHPLTVSRWERDEVHPDGATAQLLRVIEARSRGRQPSEGEKAMLLTAVATGAAIGGLVALLAWLFGKE